MSQQTNRTSILKRIRRHAADLRTLGSRTVAVTWALAEDLVKLQGTFPAGKDGNAAFKATAATASGKGEATVTNLVRAVEIRDGLTAKQRASVAGWSYDMVLSLGTMAGEGEKVADVPARTATARRNSLISKVEKSGTRSPVEVRKLKRSVTGTSKRDRQTSAEATTKLANRMKDDVAKLIGKGHDPVSLAAGARLAREYQGDVASAILFLAVNAAKAAPVVK